MKTSLIFIGLAIAQSTFAMGGKRVAPIAREPQRANGNYSVEFFLDVKFEPDFQVFSHNGDPVIDRGMLTGLLKDGKTGSTLDDVVWFRPPGKDLSLKVMYKYRDALSVTHQRGEKLTDALAIAGQLDLEREVFTDLTQLDGQKINGSLELREMLAPLIVGVAGPGSLWQGYPPPDKDEWCAHGANGTEMLCQYDRSLKKDTPFSIKRYVEGTTKLEAKGQTLRYELHAKYKQTGSFGLVYELTGNPAPKIHHEDEYLGSSTETCRSSQCGPYPPLRCRPDQHSIYWIIHKTEHRSYDALRYHFALKSIDVRDDKNRVTLLARLSRDEGSILTQDILVKGALTESWTEVKRYGPFCDN